MPALLLLATALAALAADGPEPLDPKTKDPREVVAEAMSGLATQRQKLERMLRAEIQGDHAYEPVRTELAHLDEATEALVRFAVSHRVDPETVAPLRDFAKDIFYARRSLGRPGSQGREAKYALRWLERSEQGLEDALVTLREEYGFDLSSLNPFDRTEVDDPLFESASDETLLLVGSGGRVVTAGQRLSPGRYVLQALGPEGVRVSMTPIVIPDQPGLGQFVVTLTAVSSSDRGAGYVAMVSDPEWPSLPKVVPIVGGQVAVLPPSALRITDPYAVTPLVLEHGA